MRTAFTDGQMAIQDIILEDIGLSVDLERKFHPYSIDLYIEEFYIGIEYDGMGHSFKKKDEERDAHLMKKYGLPILRLNYYKPKEDVIGAIKEFCDKWADSSDERKNKAEHLLGGDHA